MTGPEGTALSLGAQVDDGGSGGTRTYAWSVTRDAVLYASGTQETFDFTPDDEGVYTVALSVTNNGGVASDSRTIAITNASPTLTLSGAPATSLEGTTIAIMASATDPGSADVLSYAWSVSRGGSVYATGTGAAVGFTPDDDGTYVVAVTVSDGDGGTDEKSATIVVTNADPSAAISGAPATSPEGTLIALAATASDPGTADVLSYAWSVSLGGVLYASGTDATFGFTPDDDGEYVVTLTVSDDDGGSASDSRTITVTNASPTLTLSGAPTTSPEGTTIAITASATDPGSADVLSYAWSVSRGGSVYATGTGAAVGFTPDDDGTYVVAVTVSDGDGGTDVKQATVEVTNVAPSAAISGAPATSPEGTALALAATASDPGSADVLSYAWSVSWGGVLYASGTDATFGFTPADDGEYVVSLTVTDDDGGIGVAEQTITATNVAPIPSIDGPTGGVEGTLIQLTSSVDDPGVLDTFTYVWSLTRDGLPFDLPAGTTTDGPGLAFTPEDQGVYVATLTVSDDDGDSGAATFQIDVLDAAATLADLAATAIVEGDTTVLTGRIVDAGPNNSHAVTVDWGDGSAPTAATVDPATRLFTAQHRYLDDNAAGPYEITATVSNGGGDPSEATTEVSVSNAAPVLSSLAVGAIVEGGIATLGGVFDDAGTLDAHTVVVDWGDGSAATTLELDASARAFSIKHQYLDDNADDLYTIQVTLLDDDGGSTVGSTTITVTNVDPTATLDGPASGLGNQPITFSGLVTDPGTDVLTATVDFGDGTGTMPVAVNSDGTFAANHTFVVSGAYTITVRAYDDDGGSTSFTAPFLVLGGVVVNPASGLMTSEYGGTDSFSVRLAVRPSADVTIPLASNNTREGTVSVASLTFTPANWDQLQFVTISGVDDALVDGDVAFSILTGAAISADPGYEGLDAEDISAINLDNDGSSTTLQVTTLTPTASGFMVQFNRPFDPTQFNLYTTVASGLGLPDLVVTVGAGLPVRGSLLVNPASDGFTFIKTGSPLAPGTYSITLRSASNGLRANAGSLLDGNGDGTPGDDYVGSFTVAALPAKVVGTRDFVRGPGQDVLLPTLASPGLPVQINSGVGVRSVEFTVRYNPAILAITGAVLNAAAPAGWTVSIDAATPGVATVVASGPTDLSASSSPFDFLYLKASVPANAKYTNKGLIDLDGLRVLNSSGVEFASLADDAVQAVAYVGDASGNGGYSSTDSSLLQAILTGPDTGFAAYQTLDPNILGDVTNNGTFNASDVAIFNTFQTTGNANQNFIPARPSGVTIVQGGLDPKISFGKNLVAVPGGRLTVPLSFEQTDRSAVELGSFDLVIGYDPSAFRVVDVRLGSLAAEFGLTWSADPATGRIIISASSNRSTPLNPGDLGSLILLDLEVSSQARIGATPLNIMAFDELAGRGTVETFLNEGGLILVPAPTNAADDAIDGLLTIRAIVAAGASRPEGRPVPISLDALDRTLDALAEPDPVADHLADDLSDIRRANAATARSEDLTVLVPVEVMVPPIQAIRRAVSPRRWFARVLSEKSGR